MLRVVAKNLTTYSAYHTDDSEGFADIHTAIQKIGFRPQLVTDYTSL